MTNHFLAASRGYLMDQYLPQIRIAVNAIPEADLWWHPIEGSNSIGNLILHIEGNARQWILGGVAGRADARDRDAEFAAREGRSKASLLEQLGTTFMQIELALSSVQPAQLHDMRVIQGSHTTVFDAIFHVVEHVSMHTGQIIQLAKWRAPGAVRLYEATSTSFTPLWKPEPRES
ncbi:MAG: DUF1572 family protein [Gemmatimonadaceae bacterium]|nr:DUF1572 family protein [Gemmatimonadaceae bacterium]